MPPHDRSAIIVGFCMNRLHDSRNSLYPWHMR
nr:MAG TPA: hypothetical protein [Bacteriophage sp.]